MGVRAREAVVAMFAKEKAERPQIVLIRHGLLIFEIYELDQIGSVQFNKELLRLDSARCALDPVPRRQRYRLCCTRSAWTNKPHCSGRSASTRCDIRPAGKRQCNGYKRAQFEEARRKYDVAAPEEAELRRERLRLVRAPPIRPSQPSQPSQAAREQKVF